MTPTGGRVIEMDTGSGAWSVLIDGVCHRPEEVVDDPGTGRYYWSDRCDFGASCGSIQRVNANGTGRSTIISARGCDVPEGLVGDFAVQKLYWGVHGALRVMRCDLDGSNVEPVLDFPCARSVRPGPAACLRYRGDPRPGGPAPGGRNYCGR
jgi:hypothetical protein